MKAPLYDYAAEINRDRRRHARKKWLAGFGVGNRDRRRHARKKWLAGFGVGAALPLLGLFLGAGLGSMPPALSILAAVVIAWGVLGFYFLTTRH